MADIRLTGAHGVDRLIEALQASSEAAPRKASRAVADSTDRGVQVAKSEAPVDTGQLKAEIRGVATALTGLIESPTPWAGFNEFGTSRMPPNPYMGRTAAIIEPEFRAAIAEAGRPDL